MEKVVRVSLAGPVAQRRFKPRSWRQHHGESDFNDAANLLSYFCGSTREIEAYLDLLQIQTEQILSAPIHWAAVEAVATKLLEVGKLGGEDLRRVIREAMLPSGARLSS